MEAEPTLVVALPSEVIVNAKTNFLRCLSSPQTETANNKAHQSCNAYTGYSLPGRRFRNVEHDREGLDNAPIDF